MSFRSLLASSLPSSLRPRLRARTVSPVLVPCLVLGALWAACGDDSSSPTDNGGTDGIGNAGSGDSGNAGNGSGGSVSGTGGSSNEGGNGGTALNNGGSGSNPAPLVPVVPDPAKDCDAPGNAAVPSLVLTPFVDGLTGPILITQPRGETARLFIAEKPGIVRIVQEDTLLPDPFLDLTEVVSEAGEASGEMGLLGLAFHPQYAQNRRFYVYYSVVEDDQHLSRLAEYTALADDPDVADVASERVLLEIEQPEENHNGGHLAFGSDNFLYVGMGDGGGGGDAHGAAGNGQNLNTLLGKMLRIDVNGTGAGPEGAYAIPAGNMTTGGALPEIWSYGLRNPWRYSFDACTGDMYIGDVGQNALEEIDFEPAQVGGRNYGWRLMEGDECFNPDSGCDAARQNLVLPVATYERSVGQSITGGYVYRGSAIPELRGTYLYADYLSARFFALRMQNGTPAMQAGEITENINPDREVDGIASFGQDSAGNLYVVALGEGDESAGAIYRIDAE
ncbi:MAG: hypothetical protein RL685_5478 [Pseudomonadota bacterium]